MGVKIQVVDRNDRPKKNYRVHVKWTDGSSNGNTDGNGIYDTGVRGGSGATIQYVEIYGETVLGRRRVNSGELITVTTSK